MMILKKLRYQHRWSQEQLAEMAGLSVRTIQRIEAGGKANAESLKSLAAVFEVNMSLLEQEIAVIDKTKEDWEKVPYWLRGYFWGSGLFKLPERKLNLWIEQAAVVLGFAFLVWSVFQPKALAAAFVLFTAAYLVSLFTRAGDKYSIW